jgi:putative transposase
MPRKPRVLEANEVYHVYNRRTDRQLLFPSSRAYDDFLHLLEIAKQRYRVRICAYCAMDTHWHQAIWPRDGEEVTAVAQYLRWLSATHAIRFRIWTGTRGLGHVYQDRYKSVRVRSEQHYFTLIRYIEQNPLVSQLVNRAEHWPWSSLSERLTGLRGILSDGPFALPPDWIDIVNSRTPVELSEDTPPDERGGRRSRAGTEVTATP